MSATAIVYCYTYRVCTIYRVYIIYRVYTCMIQCDVSPDGFPARHFEKCALFSNLTECLARSISRSSHMHYYAII